MISPDYNSDYFFMCYAPSIVPVFSLFGQNYLLAEFGMIMRTSWIEIRRSAFFHNIDWYVHTLGSTRVAVVIKANAYGHGLESIAQLCEEHISVAWLCTASLSEAIRVRLSDVQKPILVLATLDDDIAHAAHYDIDLAVHAMEEARMINERAHYAQKKINVHVKIDTGLSRFGFAYDTAVDDVLTVASLPYINVRGIYTHCAESGGMDHAFVHEQQQRFEHIRNALHACGFIAPLYHMAKSTVAAQFPATRYDLVRIGAGAYGLCARDIGTLQQVMSWKARIMHVRTVIAGATIGYNRTYTARTDMRIAVVPIGYYEGYPATLSNKGVVRIVRTGHLIPVVGRVCMNQILCDVSQIADVTQADEVELIGAHEGITIPDIVERLGGGNERELVVRLNPLLERCIVP